MHLKHMALQESIIMYGTASGKLHCIDHDTFALIVGCTLSQISTLRCCSKNFVFTCCCMLYIRHLAFAHEHYTGDRAAVKMWYNKCIEYDVQRPDCHLFLSRAHLQDGTCCSYIYLFHRAIVPVHCSSVALAI
jgi:hypothetical protein